MSELNSVTVPSSNSKGYRFGFDIGGTFTDFVLINTQSGQIASYKTPTTPHNPSQAVMEGWRQLLEDVGTKGEAVETAIHGTTLITNALIERKGSVALFLTTSGFSDVLDTQREMRYDIYDLHSPQVFHLIPRPLRFEVEERLDAFGNVLEPLDYAGLEALRDTLEAAGVTDHVEGVAVCLLHSFTNPVHEEAVGGWLREHLPGMSVSLSHEVAPRYANMNGCQPRCAMPMCNP